MARSLPANTQATQGQAHTGPPDAQLMHLRQVLHQQPSGPDRRLIAPLPRVVVDHRVNQGLNDAMYRARPTTVPPWRDPRLQSEGLAHLELGQPCVDCLSADPQPLSYLLDAFSPLEPQQGLGAAQGYGLSRMTHQIFQSLSLQVLEPKSNHRLASDYSGSAMTPWICQRNF